MEANAANMRQCPVCLGRVALDQFETHMGGHSKEEVLAALLRSNPQEPIRPNAPPTVAPPPAYPAAGYHFLAAAAAAAASSTSGSVPGIPTSSGSAVPAVPGDNVLVPHMMGMSMVMSPVLIPQQNGPPIIFNVPSYVYPNVLNSSASTASTTALNTTSPSSTSLTTRPSAAAEVKTEPAASVVERKPCTASGSSDEAQRVLTVETVNDLINAQDLLKSNEDIQIVVANDLLETNEFKTFMSHLNLPSNNSDQHNANAGDHNAPPNTPTTTRPPSANHLKSEPQPSTSSSSIGDQVPVSSPMLNENQGEKIICGSDSDPEDDNDSEDDELCLQDLVAMETMEQVDEDHENVVMETDDQVFTLASYKSASSLEPSFVSAILTEQTESFECDACGLHFPSHEAYHMHRVDSCRNVKESKNNGSKVKRSGIKPPSYEILAEVKSEASSLLSAADLPSGSSTSILKTEFGPVQPALGSVSGGPGDNWKCNKCLAVFTSAMELFQHHNDLKAAEHKCMLCHVILDDKKMLLAHKKEFHSGSSAPPSMTSFKIKIEEDYSNLDMKLGILPNDKGEYICQKCDRAFTDQDLFVKHLSCHEEEKPFECLECGKKFSKAILLRDHRKRHFEKGSYECTFCPKKFHTPIKLREHIRVHTGEAPLLCNICGKGFKRHSNLSEHKRIHDENRPAKPAKELFCHCGQVFKTKRELDWHNEEIHERVPKKCNFCGEVFVHSTSLTRHIRRKHQADFMPTDKKESLSAKCPVCLQTFYKTSINKHIRIKHQGLKPFVCEICKMGFVTKNNLENHQWQHKGVRSRPFKCQLCRKAYLRQSQLDAHMRAHRGIKPFVCNDCGLQFSNKSNWQRHVSEHSGARNHACPHCNKKFSRSYYLTDHMKVHTGVKPFSCAICGKMAATRSNYNSHLRTHIAREPVNSEV